MQSMEAQIIYITNELIRWESRRGVQMVQLFCDALEQLLMVLKALLFGLEVYRHDDQMKTSD
jgi:hypothetical protein